ncbi:MAG: phosphatase PAP2 family protein [Chitinophagaceae bacterium]
MNILQSKQSEHFRIAAIFCFCLAFATGLFLFIYGKTNSFIIINGHYNQPLDFFFQYMTLLGDGLIYIPIVLYCIVLNRRFILPVVFCIIICTLITHFLKRVVFPDELRPISLEMQQIIIHKVKGVPLNRLHSFPSGHTSTAFSMALLLTAIMKRKFWCFVLPLIAFLVGYSRVYLGQHFVTDVFAGMLVGILSAYLSLALYHWYQNKNGKKQMPEPTL